MSEYSPFNQLKKLDMFAARLPSFNMKGKEAVSTSIGGILSIIIYMMTFVFSLVKIQDLFLRKNPIILSNTDLNAFGNEKKFSTGTDGF